LRLDDRLVTDMLDDTGGELLPIGVFAREVRLAVSAVRFYDDCGLLPPAFVDPSSGYRYYRADQVERGRLIRDLRAAEMSIAQIRSVIDASADKALTMLAEHRTALDRRVTEAKQRLASASAALTRPEIRMPTTCVLAREEFLTAVRQVAPSAAPLGTAPDQNIRVIEGVLVAVDDGVLRLVATDRYRLAIRELVPTAIDGADERVVVEASDLRELTVDNGGDEVTIRLGDAAEVVSSDVTRPLRVIAGAAFPPYERLLPDATSLVHRGLMTAGALRSELERLADHGVVALHLDDVVSVGPLDERPRSLEGSEATGPPVTIGVRPQFLLDAAQLAVGPELLIEASSPTSPLVVRSATDGSYTCLIMPVRIEFPSTPQNLAFAADEHGRAIGWQAPPPAQTLPDAAATTTSAEGALTITANVRSTGPVAAWQVIDAVALRGRTVTLAARVNAALDDDSSARLVLEPLAGDDPAAQPTHRRVASQNVHGTVADHALAVSLTVPDDARWLRVALVVDGLGSATFTQVAFDA
jgi:DNA-binding transcriptional MerR regulator